MMQGIGLFQVCAGACLHELLSGMFTVSCFGIMISYCLCVFGVCLIFCKPNPSNVFQLTFLGTYTIQCWIAYLKHILCNIDFYGIGANCDQLLREPLEASSQKILK